MRRFEALRSSGARRALAAAFLALGASACRSYELPRTPDNLSTREEWSTAERTSYWPNGAKHVVWQCRQSTHGRMIKHGREQEFDEAGHCLAERFFREGEPVGNWTRWWPNGNKRMEILYRGPQIATAMSWWFENGALESQGPARDGLKDGAWTSWDSNGQMIEQGSFRAGRREGPWRAWYADGRPRSEGSYADNRRVGAWRLWDERGELVIKQGPELPEDAPAGAPR